MEQLTLNMKANEDISAKNLDGKQFNQDDQLVGRDTLLSAIPDEESSRTKERERKSKNERL